MPPRNAPDRRGQQGEKGYPSPLGGRDGGASRGSQPGGLPADHVEAVGLKRPNFGTAGLATQMQVNSFAVDTIPQKLIFHYDVVVEPDKLPAHFNMELFKILQSEEPDIFAPKIVYDGRKIAFAPRELPLGENRDSRQFAVTLPQANGDGNLTRQSRIHYITLTKVAEINPELLDRFVDGKQSTDETILTALTALNVVIRMEPNQNYPFNKRSFYTPQDKRSIGGGMELWRGIFQSVRPAIGRLVVNVDLATGVMYKAGGLIDLCIEFLNRPPNSHPGELLSPINNRYFSERDRFRLEKFLSGLRIEVSTTETKPRVIRGLSKVGANNYRFQLHAGNTDTVAQYFHSLGRPLQFPTAICVQVGSGAMIPLEICTVPRGQIMRKQIPDDKMKDVFKFSTMKPNARLQRIKTGIQNLQFGQSDYVKQFGMTIDTEPLTVDARILKPPTLKYGASGKQATVDPENGVWNMLDKRLYRPVNIDFWAIAIYATPDKFNDKACSDVVKGFLDACAEVGIVAKASPVIKYNLGHGDIAKQLREVGKECKETQGGLPSLILVVLPEGGNDIYTAVKHFGDVTAGVATQCLKANKCWGAKPQYWANVLLKVNVKLGGVNLILDPSTTGMAALSDPANPTIVIGADVVHPAPGADGRPSFTAVVGSVDSNASKYVATSRAQTGRQEIIDGLKDMCQEILTLHMRYREKAEEQVDPAPKRLIFYRDGVSEGQFKQVLDLELPLIKEACEELKINPKITLIIVGKRHHNQFFPLNNKTDKNAPAGSVVDTGIAHPTEFDFFLQSHAGILGTSRPAHYNVLYDESGFNADSIQALSFALCHVYARSTRSVSIPAPVYYADIVCARAKNHFDPAGDLALSDTCTQPPDGGPASLEAYKLGYKPLHVNQRSRMYFT